MEYSVNDSSLSDEFELNLSKEIKNDTKEITNSLKLIKDSHNPEQLLKDNIDRCTIIYDKLLTIIGEGVFSDKLAQAAASLTNSITNAVNAIASLYIHDDNIELKTKNLKIKEEELKLRLQEVKKPNNQTNILVIENREKILKALRSDNIDMDQLPSGEFTPKMIEEK